MVSPLAKYDFLFATAIPCSDTDHDIGAGLLSQIDKVAVRDNNRENVTCTLREYDKNSD